MRFQSLDLNMGDNYVDKHRYTEFFMSKNKYIPTIFWTKVGIVILQREELPNGTNRYSVITAYGKQSPVGQKIGTIENKKTS